MALERDDRSSGSTVRHLLTRRDVLRSAGFSIGILAFGQGALASCASDDSEDPSGAPGSADPVSGGTLSAAVAVSFPNLDTITSPSAGSVVASWFWGERLYRLDQFPPRNELFPGLATEPPTMVSPTVYRVPLRPDTTFHSGRAFTADDVVFTFSTLLDPATAAQQYTSLSFITEVRAVDPHTVEFELSTPTTRLASRLATVTIHPADATAASSKLAPVGTGPYRVVSATSNGEIILERFAEYSGGRDLRYDTIELHYVADANARLSGLQTGQFDIIEDVPISSVESLGSDDRIELEAVPSYGWTPVMFNCGRAPFDNPAVRRAVMYSIDRDTINEVSLFGLGEPAWTGFVPPSHPDFVEPDQVYSYDPDRARELLSDAGLGGEPIPIEILVPTDVDYVASQSSIIEQNLRDVGFEPLMTQTTSASIWTPITEGSFDAALTAAADFSADSTDLDSLALGSFSGFVAENLTRWTGPAADEVAELLAQAFSTDDEETRTEALTELQNIIQDEASNAALFHVPKISAWSPDLQDYQPHSTYGIAPLDGVHG